MRDFIEYLCDYGADLDIQEAYGKMVSKAFIAYERPLIIAIAHCKFRKTRNDIKRFFFKLKHYSKMKEKKSIQLLFQDNYLFLKI